MITEELVSKENFKTATGIKNDRLAQVAMHSMKLDQLNELYAGLNKESQEALLNDLIQKFNIQIDINEEDLKNIPLTGSFITVSNHPFGGWDGIVLLHLLQKIRRDYKLMANFILSSIEPLKDSFVAVNPFEDRKDISSLSGFRKAYQLLSEGNPIGFFPAGEVSSFQSGSNKISDKKWDAATIRLIKKANVPVIPIYFHGANSFLFHGMGLLHPKLRTAQLVNELYKKKDAVIKVRIGKPISVRDQKEFANAHEFGRYLRARTYCLGTKLDPQKFFFPNQIQLSKPKDIIPEIDNQLIINEINKIRENDFLFTVGDFDIFCCNPEAIPNALKEIGRLREITFRKAGEGSNKSVDLDQYDLYYKHLFIWDKKKNQIVGSYRIGEGQKIFKQYRKQGFYLHSLFKIKKEFNPILSQALELGRSFIREEYQRNPSSLFLLWKGILYYLLKNNDYRYLIGPVSISGQYSKLSKGLMIEFIKQNYFDSDLAQHIKPRKKFRYNLKNSEINTESFLKGNIKQLDSLIEEIEPNHFKTPVLIKKYIKQNARFVGFNIDPKFNNALDGFIVLDLHNVDEDTIKSLTKELNDDSILNQITS